MILNSFVSLLSGNPFAPMLNFPASTELHKRIPKQTLYRKLPLSATLKRCIVEQIKSIVWSHKLSADTLRVSTGKQVDEIQVIEISLTERKFNEDVIRVLESMIPYSILFLLEHNGRYQARISYKECSPKGDAKVLASFHSSGWCLREKLPCRLQGLTMDSIYENLVRQIAGKALTPPSPAESLEASVQRAREKCRLVKQITALKNKIRREKQLNRQVELNRQVRLLQAQLDSL